MRLLGDRLGHHRVGVTERHHRDAGEEIEVALAVHVPQLGALPSFEHDLGGAEHRHERAVVERLEIEVVVHQRGGGPCACSGPVGRADDHRADTGVGEHLEQQHVLDPSVEDVGAPHAVAHGLRAARHLRDHPAGDRAVGDERIEFVGRRLADEAARVVDVAAQALDVGEIDELLRAEGLGDGAGDGVGVDVVRLPEDVAADRGDHRDELVVDQAEDHLRVDLGDVADEAELRDPAPTARIRPASIPLSPTA